MTWLVDGRMIARKVKNPKHLANESGRRTKCPSCGHMFNVNDQAPKWPGLPSGVKFDPSDQELLEHLAAKVAVSAELHPFIDEFIPTLDVENGICYTHPEKLPGAHSDGSSIHFFHIPAKAYTTGNRKRRKIQLGEGSRNQGEVRWHKTGKTRPVIENGKQLGCKKIMVLHASSGKKAKIKKTNWVMHQYHLGVHEEEREGEFVVSKIFYQTQPRQLGGTQKVDDNFEQHEEPCAPISTDATASPEVTEHKGLLGVIAKEVDCLNATLDEKNVGEPSSCIIEGNPELVIPCLPETPLENKDCETQPSDESITGLHASAFDQLSGSVCLESLPVSLDSFDADIMKLLCNENLHETLQTALKLNGKSDSLDNLVLDTPPDLKLSCLPDPLVSSQEFIELFTKKKVCTDSQEILEWFGKRFLNEPKRTSGYDKKNEGLDQDSVSNG